MNIKFSDISITMYQQACLMMNEKMKSSFEELLINIARLKGVPKPGYRCYMSYAWPIESNSETESLVQPFLINLHAHLKLAGIYPILDLINYRDTDDIYSFSSMANDTDFVLLFGTPSLRSKHEDPYWNPEKIVMANTISKQHRDTLTSQHRVLPIILIGAIVDSFISIFENIEVIDWCAGEYLAQLQNLLSDIYFQKHPSHEYNKLWSSFKEQFPHSLTPEKLEDHIPKVKLFFKQCISINCTDARLSYLHKERHLESVCRKILLKERQGLPPTHVAFHGSFQLPRVSHFFTGRQIELSQIDTMLNNTLQNKKLGVCITGFPGIGKTQLVAMYLKMITDEDLTEASKNFKNVIWMLAGSENPEDTPKLLRRQFIKLANSLEMDTVRATSDNEVYQYVYEKLGFRGKCLIVFDNVHGPSQLSPFMPPNNECFSVLLTTRNSLSAEWREQFDLLLLDNFLLETAVRYISSFLENKKPQSQYSTHDIKELATTCGRYPLMLSQALAYILNNNKTIPSYLSLLTNSPDKIYSTKLFSNDPYKLEKNNEHELYQPISATLHGVLKSIFSRLSPQAKTLLSVCILIPNFETLDLTILRKSLPNEPIQEQLTELLKSGIVVASCKTETISINRVLKIVFYQLFCETSQQSHLPIAKTFADRYLQIKHAESAQGTLMTQQGFHVSSSEKRHNHAYAITSESCAQPENLNK